MPRRLTALLLLLLLTVPVSAQNDGPRKQPHAPAEAYHPVEVLGWTLRVHEDLIADEQLYDQVLGEVHHQLFRLTRIIPTDKLAMLRQVVIWVELRNPNGGMCQYHPSRRWLEDNGFLPEKAKCVEISDAREFLRYTERAQPYVLLHELSHAYHDQHLGFDHAGVREAYEAAKQTGTYNRVQHISGREQRHYALTDHKEYFAEATEAFFGTNDFYPYVRSELKAHDPAMHDLLAELWGVE